MPKERLYMAYGSNMNLAQMKYRCPTARVLGTAEIDGYELLFRGGAGAVATIEPARGASVPVLLWSIRAADELSLDRYEGFPRLYTKKNLEVKLDSKPVKAMVYTMVDGHAAGMPSQRYLNSIAEGYRSAGLDLEVLSAALGRTAEVILMEAQEHASWLSEGLGQGEVDEEPDQEQEDEEDEIDLYDGSEEDNGMRWW